MGSLAGRIAPGGADAAADIGLALRWSFALEEEFALGGGEYDAGLVSDGVDGLELCALRLVDEYRVYLQPAVLGVGHPVFPPSETRLPLRLIERHRFGNGIVLLEYAAR